MRSRARVAGIVSAAGLSGVAIPAFTDCVPSGSNVVECTGVSADDVHVSAAAEPRNNGASPRPDEEVEDTKKKKRDGAPLSISYCSRVAGRMGGISSVQPFFSFYLIPDSPHRGAFMAGPTVPLPLPQSSLGRDEMFASLQSWVGNGTAPARLDVTSPNGAVSMPLCL